MRERRGNIFRETPEFYFWKTKSILCIIALLFLAIGEGGLFIYLFSDWLGLDPSKIGSEFTKYPISALSILSLSIVTFAGLLLLAKRVINSQKRWGWISLLFGISVIIGIMRAQQLAAVSGEGWAYFLPIIYALASFGFPFVGAVLEKILEDNWKSVKAVESTRRRLNEEELYINSLIEEKTNLRQREVDKLQKIITEYSAHYQNVEINKEKIKTEWEQFSRWLEARLAEYRLAYAFWKARQNKLVTIPRLAKELPTAMIVAIILVLFSLVGCRSSYAEEGFNITLLCDRSSSGSEFSCLQQIIQKASDLWLRKADEHGGGTFEIHLIGKGFDNADVLFSEKYPERFSGPVSVNKKKWRDNFRKKLSEKTSALPTDKGSAIAEGIFRSSLRMPENGKTLLIIASDMRQVSDNLNFEKKVPSFEEFMRWLDSKGIRPKFQNSARIAVCGVHPYTPSNTSKMKTETYVRLTSLWHRVFEKWGIKASISETCDFRDY